MSNKEVIDQLFVDIVGVYSKVNSNLVLVSEKYAKTKLETIYSEYRNLVRSGAASTSPRICAFQEKCGKLFDMIFCKCKIEQCSEVNCTGCEQAAHIQCKCLDDKKIPVFELSYVLDQRRRQGNKGNMQMGGWTRR